jgi:hypothetical protein
VALGEVTSMSNFEGVLTGLVAVIALAMLLQSIGLLIAVAVMRKATQRAEERFEEIRAAVMPVVERARTVFERMGPNIEKAASDLSNLTEEVRSQTADVRSALVEIVGRARHQAERVDGMVSGVLDGVDRAGTFVSETVQKPVRQISALVASFKAAVEALRASEPGRPARGVRYAGSQPAAVDGPAREKDMYAQGL